MQPEDRDGHATGKWERERLWGQSETRNATRGRRVETALSQRRDLLGEDSSALKFASTNSRWWFQSIAVSALLAGLFLTGFLSGASKPAYAQSSRSGITARVPLTKFPGLGSTQFLPAGVTQRVFNRNGGSLYKAAGGKKGQTRAQLGGEFGFDVAEKTVDVTRLPGSDEAHPFWSGDGTALYFEGNASFVGDSNSDGYQLYRMVANTSGGVVPTSVVPTRLTNDAGVNYFFPVLNTAGNRIAFTRQQPGSTQRHLYVALNPANPIPGDPNSFIPSVAGDRGLISLTNSDPAETLRNRNAVIDGRTFVDVQRATFVNATDVVFSAKLSGVNGGPASPYHLFTVNLTELKVRQITDGAADEQNPTISPDGRFVAFDSNAVPGSYATATASTGVVAATNNTQANRNIFTIGGSGQSDSPATIFSYDGGNIFNNVQPAWSRLDANNLANPGGSVYYLAYASNRKPDNTAAATTDIYYKVANGNAAVATSTLQRETSPVATNPSVASRLDTADDDFTFNDEYPTFPPFRNVLQVAFQSDRQGTQAKPNVPGSGFTKTSNIHDLFVATLFDINAPTLLRWDSSSNTGDIVHINAGSTYNSSPGSAIRNREQGLLPGTTVFFTVRAEDLESGIDSVYLQFKNPNSKYQASAQGGSAVEHKEYDPGVRRTVTYKGFDYPDFQINASNIADGAYPYTESNNGGYTNLYLQAGQQSGVANATNVGREYEAEAINAEDRVTYVNHRRNRNNKTGPLPLAGLDDLAAFSGGAFLDSDTPFLNNPRLNPTKSVAEGGSGAWLKLKPLPDAPQQGGPGGTLYGASWTVPAEASDWYMDVILFDKAVNPLTPSQRSNWIIYDNVWGFSSALSLSPQAIDILVVMDYALGQKFFTSRFGTTGDAFGRGVNNLPNIEYGVESYFTDPDIARNPDGEIAPNPPTAAATPPRRWDIDGPFTGHPSSVGGMFTGTPNVLGVNSYIDALLFSEAQAVDSIVRSNPRGGTRTQVAYLPATGRYSLWRVLSRGPVPVNLLTDYLPTRTTSPPDQFLDANGLPLETTPRTVLHANRMVVWASPYSANVFAGAGTIQDLQTQDNLRNFVNQGGRLFISGEDIGFTLAGNGQANTFFTDTLKAQLISDSNNNAYTAAAAGTTTINTDAFGADSSRSHPYAQINIGSPNSYTPPTSLGIVHEALGSGVDFLGDASFAADAEAGFAIQGFLDIVAPLAGATSEYTLGAGSTMISSSNAGGGRVVYSTGFEGISNGYYTYTLPNSGPTVIATRGRRAAIMHNITSALRTSTLTGRILDQNGTPVTDALVRAVRNQAPENQLAAGTGFTDGNGNYQIQGLAPGQYQVYGYRANYYTQKSTTEIVDGAARATINLVLRKAGPGGLGGVQSPTSGRNSGGVFRTDDKTPITNVRVYAIRTDAGQTGPVTSVYFAKTSDGTLAVDGVNLPPGQYSFGTQLAIGDYEVIANPDTLIGLDGQPILGTDGQPVKNPEYNSSFATVILKNPPQAETTLGPNTTVANNRVQVRESQTAQIDFRLGSSPQKVAGRVVDQDGNPLPGAIIGGALSSTPGTIVVQSAAATDTNGNYTLVTTGATPSADIPEGTYILTATLIGYGTGTVTINVGGSGTLTVPDIKLGKLQPGSVSGLVTGGAKLTTPIAGATVTLFPYVNGAPIDAGKQTVTSTTVTNGVNFRFASVPPGQYVATAQYVPAGAPAGALPLVATSAVFTVAENAETSGITIQLTPLQTYPAGLQMIALPNNYSGATPYQVFGLTPNGDNDEDGTPGSTNDQSIYNVFTVAGWKPDQTGYEFFGQRFTTDPNYNANLRFQEATGYFVRFGANTPVVLGGQGTPANTFDKTLATPGWYIIGNPFGTLTLPAVRNVPLNLATDVTFTYQINGVQRNAVLLDQAVADGAVQRVVFDFSGSNAGSQYRQTTSILPFQGYWFRSYVANMVLRFTYPGVNGDLTRSTTSPSTTNSDIMAASVAELIKLNKTRAVQAFSPSALHRSVASKGTSDWRLQLAARQGDLIDSDNSIGVAPNAKDGFDTNFDTTKPPMLGQDQSLYLTINGSDDKGRSVSTFSDNIRAAGTSAKSWDFTVQTTSDQEVTLYWPNVNRLPRNLDPVLVDTQTGRRVSLRTGGASYRYMPKGRSAQFRIEVNTAASRPLALTNVKTSRVQTGAGDGKSIQSAYRFSFTATQEADVTAEIQSMNGRTLRRMQTRAQASHESAFVWDGRDDSGSSLPAGTYIISLTAKDANTGALVRTRIPVLSVR